uniref:Uncharacterized protein n=1 Tax=Arundo donax TaxID=35708 RepID=A0A0A9GAQ8_ARUDO
MPFKPAGNGPDKELPLASSDCRDRSPSMDSGSGPEKLFPASDRFCRLRRLPISSGIGPENRLLEISMNFKLFRLPTLLGRLPERLLLAIESFTSMVRLANTERSATPEIPWPSSTTPATLAPLHTMPFQEAGQPLKSMDSSFQESVMKPAGSCVIPFLNARSARMSCEGS